MLTDQQLDGIIAEADALYAEQQSDIAAYHRGNAVQKARRLQERLGAGAANVPLWGVAQARVARLQMA